MKLLFVNSCVTSKTNSGAYLLASGFIEEYTRQNPKDKITQLDLAAGRLTPLSYYDIMMRTKGTWQKANYARQFLEHDKIVIAAPGWDFGSPSILRVYIEHVCLPGTTFIRTDSGYSGFCSGKKALFISDMKRHAMSGIPTDFEYLQSVFHLLGIDDFTEIHAERPKASHAGMMRLWETAKEKASRMAQTW